MRSGGALIDSHKVLAQIGIAPGMHVADFGCGRTGQFVLPAARVVGEEGRVYAVDVAKQHLAMLGDRCAVHGVANVHPVWGDYERRMGVDIPEYSLDGIFLVNNLPLLEQPDALAWEAHRLLAPGGKLLVVDWHPHHPHPVAPPAHVRLPYEDALFSFEKLGFVHDRDIEVAPSHWGILFKAT